MTENFSNIKDILNGVQFRNVNSAFGQIIADWDNIVGKKFAGKSELADIVYKGTKLILCVHVFSSPLVQELTFFKRNLIKKIKDKYNLEIFDMVIKVAEKKSIPEAKQTIVQETYDERPTDEELKNIKLDETIVEQMRSSVENQPVLTDAQKARMLEIIMNDLKTQEWMKQKGFPVCKKCGRVLTSKNFGEENLCRFCKNTETIT